ncbi:MAG: toxin TumE [Thermodesulfobacteriota bacterium]
MLEINEAVIIEGHNRVTLDYRYHLQDEESRLIFRYDSTPHFPEMPNFPHHKHLPDGVLPFDKPDIEQLVQEALEITRLDRKD